MTLEDKKCEHGVDMGPWDDVASERNGELYSAYCDLCNPDGPEWEVSLNRERRLAAERRHQEGEGTR